MGTLQALKWLCMLKGPNSKHDIKISADCMVESARTKTEDSEDRDDGLDEGARQLPHDC